MHSSSLIGTSQDQRGDGGIWCSWETGRLRMLACQLVVGDIPGVGTASKLPWSDSLAQEIALPRLLSASESDPVLMTAPSSLDAGSSSYLPNASAVDTRSRSFVVQPPSLSSSSTTSSHSKLAATDASPPNFFRLAGSRLSTQPLYPMIAAMHPNATNRAMSIARFTAEIDASVAALPSLPVSVQPATPHPPMTTHRWSTNSLFGIGLQSIPDAQVNGLAQAMCGWHGWLSMTCGQISVVLRITQRSHASARAMMLSATPGAV